MTKGLDTAESMKMLQPSWCGQVMVSGEINRICEYLNYFLQVSFENFYVKPLNATPNKSDYSKTFNNDTKKSDASSKIAAATNLYQNKCNQADRPLSYDYRKNNIECKPENETEKSETEKSEYTVPVDLWKLVEKKRVSFRGGESYRYQVS